MHFLFTKDICYAARSQNSLTVISMWYSNMYVCKRFLFFFVQLKSKLIRHVKFLLYSTSAPQVCVGPLNLIVELYVFVLNLDIFSQG